MIKKEYIAPEATTIRVTAKTLTASQPTIEFTQEDEYADPEEEIL